MATNRKLGKPSDQRRAMLRAMTTYLLENGQIKTTYARAKEVAVRPDRPQVCRPQRRLHSGAEDGPPPRRRSGDGDHPAGVNKRADIPRQ